MFSIASDFIDWDMENPTVRVIIYMYVWYSTVNKFYALANCNAPFISGLLEWNQKNSAVFLIKLILYFICD